MDDQVCESLIPRTAESYGESFKVDLLEQYKLCVHSAENVSARRIASNQYLLTLNTALVALYGLQSANFGQGYWTLLIPAMGVLVSMVWFQIIKSHADLNSVKFKLIHEFERRLPAVRCTNMSGNWLKRGKGKHIAQSPPSNDGYLSCLERCTRSWQS